ncbi:MAG: hypothetical protein ABJB76_09280 [Candidatus Nitrosocosmicus sp.]
MNIGLPSNLNIVALYVNAVVGWIKVGKSTKRNVIGDKSSELNGIFPPINIFKSLPFPIPSVTVILQWVDGCC